MMQAVVYEQYGAPDVLRLVEIPQPTPKAGEVLVHIQAASLNAADGYLLRGEPFLLRADSGLTRPKRPILGADIAGRVVAVGEGVTRLRVGDAVYGDLSSAGLGGFAEYVATSERALAHMPTRLSFEEAAALPMASVTALQALRAAGRDLNGLRVAINGASGGVGTFAVQIARAQGAEVTAVCSTRHVARMRQWAHHVIDYTRDDFTAGKARFDVIVGVNGYHPLRHYRRALAHGGVYVCAGGQMRQIFGAILLGWAYSRGGVTLRSMGTAKPSADDLALIADMADSGAITPFVERVFPLSQTADAFRHLKETGASGKLVVAIG